MGDVVMERTARGDSAWGRRFCRSELTPEELGVLEQVLHAVRSIRHGHVQVVIQDARVVQIDRTEKVRLERSGDGQG